MTNFVIVYKQYKGKHMLAAMSTLAFLHFYESHWCYCRYSMQHSLCNTIYMHMFVGCSFLVLGTYWHLSSAGQQFEKYSVHLRNTRVIVFGSRFFCSYLKYIWKIHPQNSGFIPCATHVFRRRSAEQKTLVERYGLALIGEPTVNGELHFLTSKTFQVHKIFFKSPKKLNLLAYILQEKELIRWEPSYGTSNVIGVLSDLDKRSNPYGFDS